MKYTFMEQYRQEFPVVKMSDVLEVSKQGFYNWLKRSPSKRFEEKRKLQAAIKKLYESHGKMAGSPTITADLKDEPQWRNVSRSRVALEMKEMDIKCQTRRKFTATTDSKHKLPIAPNILDRKFSQASPNMAWVSDLTYLRVKARWVYLVVFIDLFSRKVVGWDLSESLDSQSTVNAFDKALWNRTPKAGLLVHSDRGIQYASKHFRSRINKHGCKQSMSRKGNCWDNAVSESFFSTLKTRLTHHRSYDSMEDLRRDIFWYIEIYYNRYRKHSSNNWQTPEQKELSLVSQTPKVA